MVAELLDVGHWVFLAGIPESLEPRRARLRIGRRFGNDGGERFYGVVDRRPDGP